MKINEFDALNEFVPSDDGGDDEDDGGLEWFGPYESHRDAVLTAQHYIRLWSDPKINQPIEGYHFQTRQGPNGFYWKDQETDIEKEPMEEDEVTEVTEPLAVGAKIRTKRMGMEGVVQKIEGDEVFFKAGDGRLMKTNASNVLPVQKLQDKHLKEFLDTSRHDDDDDDPEGHGHGTTYAALVSDYIKEIKYRRSELKNPKSMWRNRSKDEDREIKIQIQYLPKLEDLIHIFEFNIEGGLKYFLSLPNEVKERLAELWDDHGKDWQKDCKSFGLLEGDGGGIGFNRSADQHVVNYQHVLDEIMDRYMQQNDVHQGSERREGPKPEPVQGLNREKAQKIANALGIRLNDTVYVYKLAKEMITLDDVPPAVRMAIYNMSDPNKMRGMPTTPEGTLKPDVVNKLKQIVAEHQLKEETARLEKLYRG
jgi:hypothetical protein